MVPSEIYQMNGIVAFILHFGWQNIYGIAEEQPVYISVSICKASDECIKQALHWLKCK